MFVFRIYGYAVLADTGLRVRGLLMFSISTEITVLRISLVMDLTLRVRVTVYDSRSWCSIFMLPVSKKWRRCIAFWLVHLSLHHNDADTGLKNMGHKF